MNAVFQLSDKQFNEWMACNKDVITIDEACIYMDCDKKYLKSLIIQKKVVPIIASDRKIYFERKTLFEYMKANTLNHSFTI